MRSLRCLPGALVTRRAQLSLPSCARFQSTLSAPVVRKHMARDLHGPAFPNREKEQVKDRYQQLAQILSSTSPIEVHLDLEKLQRELIALHNRRQKLFREAESRPAQNLRAEVKIERGKVILQGRTIPNIWLRDNCQCSSCVHESTKQRLQDTFAIPRDLTVKAGSVTKHVDAVTPLVSIEWSDGHESTYSQSFLTKAIANAESKSAMRQGWAAGSKLELWSSDIAQSGRKFPSVPYKVATDKNMKPVLRRLRQFGFCYINDTPHDDPQHTEELLRRIAFIRETHYGGFYDFTADLASQDTAYTNIALEAHTDNTYFSDPAGLQAFHLLSHTDGTGGASLLVDGFKVADELLQTDPAAYRILSKVNVHAHASGNQGISIQPYRGFPVLEHDPTTGNLLRVRWNSADRAGIELPVEEVEVWYDAARKFDALLKKKENEYWEQLVPGRVLVFDNWRVLHGRSSFTGKRRICGGYINRDDWMSRYKMETFGPEKVLGALAGS